MSPTARPTVAIDVTPLIGPRSGVGVATAEIIAAFGALEAGPALVPYTLSARARRHRAGLPAGTRFVPIPARLLLRSWARTDAPRIDVLAQRDDRPGDFEPDDRRRIRWRRIASRALQTVGTIDTCVGDANQDVASLGRGHLRFRDSQHFRRSGLAGSDKAHDGG